MTRPLTLVLLLLVALGVSLPTGIVHAAEDSDGKRPETSSEEKESEEGEEDESDDDDDSEKDADKAKDDEDEADEKKPKKKKKKRKTATVEEKPLKVEVTLDGTFVARNMTPVALRPEAWSSFKIEEVVEHGAEVRQGEVLVEFESKKLEEEIADLELSQRLTDLSIRKAEQELPRVEKSLEMSLADAKQSHERVNDDYKRYKEVERDRQIKSLQMLVKQYKQRVDYAKDELEQLEKMYEADDLTEETEELILERTRQQLEISEYYYNRYKDLYEDEVNIYLPRQDVDNREAVDRVDLSLARAKLASQIDLNEARYKLEQQKVRRDKSLERHAKLVQDRGLMKLQSPAEGIVYYGRCVNGKWSDMSSMMSKLKPHNSVSSGTVMMTIVDPEELFLMATVGEKERPTVESGQSAKIKPSGEGAEALAGSVASVSSIPVSSGKFALEVDLTDDHPDWLVPGMTGKIKITTYDNKEALVLNKKAVHAGEDDEDEKYVWLVEEDDDEVEVEKQRVKVGKTKGDLVEILDGLDEGDVVSLEDEEEEDDD